MTLFRITTVCTLLLAVLITVPNSSFAQDQKTAAWSYEGDTGPQNWASLSTDYAVCNGNEQSPINIKKGKRKRKPVLNIKYGSSKATIVNRKRATQVNTTEGQISIGSDTYELRQFHVHMPAEHTVKRNRHAGEIHLVHQSEETGELAVMAVFIRKGKKTGALGPLVKGVEKGQKRTKRTYNVRNLFPKNWRSSYYIYDGSLTTPPCTENVRWVILRNPIRASKKQVKKLRARYKENNRPRQPRNDRTVIRRVTQ